MCDCQKEYKLHTCVALLYIHHYICLNGIYFSLENCSVEPKTEAVSPSQAPSVHPSASVFIGLGSIGELDQAFFNIRSESILPFKAVREPDHEGPVVCMSWCHLVRPHLWDGFVLPVPMCSHYHYMMLHHLHCSLNKSLSSDSFHISVFHNLETFDFFQVLCKQDFRILTLTTLPKHSYFKSKN